MHENPSVNSTTRRIIERPLPEEYSVSSQPYIDLVKDEIPILEQLYLNAEIIIKLFNLLPEEKLAFRYQSNKWSLKEVLVHLVDDERIYAYRALRFARNDLSILTSFDQDLFTKYANVSQRSLANILDEYSSNRASTIALFEGMTSEALVRTGKTDEWRGSVRALLYHLTGHELNHLRIIREKYLV